MKRIFTILALSLLAISSASAQSDIWKAVVGPYTNANGEIAISDPHTVIAVDYTLEKEQTIVGPYARYAQKYLDVRGSLVEKTTYSIKSANLAVMTCNAPLSAGELAEPTTAVQSHLHSATEFAKVSPDRLSLSPISTEDAAAQAAQAIFTLRKKRVDLITGDAGENVFGGGLKDALEALDAREQALLELFLGKKIVSTFSKRIVVPLRGATASYTIAKLSASAGLLPESASEGDEIKLNINPSGVTPALANIEEADRRDKTAIKVRLADNATCTVTIGSDVVGSAILPVFEFGRTALVTNTLTVKK